MIRAVLLVAVGALLLTPTAKAAPMRDAAGLPFHVKPHPRIVSIAPALTEILYAIGAGPDLVADSDYCDFPAAARKLPHVGSLNTLKVEQIVALRPDLIVTAAGPNDQWVSLEHLARAPVFVARDGSVDAIMANTTALGSFTGKVGPARKLVSQIQDQLRALAARTKGQPHPTVFYMVWNDPLQTAGPGSYLDELIADAGGRNVAPSGRGLYPRMSWETLVARPPQVVIGPMNLENDVLAAGRKLHARKAVALDEDVVSRPGPRVVQALRLLYKAIH